MAYLSRGSPNILHDRAIHDHSEAFRETQYGRKSDSRVKPLCEVEAQRVSQVPFQRAVRAGVQTTKGRVQRLRLSHLSTAETGKRASVSSRPFAAETPYRAVPLPARSIQ